MAFFIPLVVFSLILAAVLGTTLEAPPVAQTFVAVIPNLLAASCMAAIGGAWSPLVLQIILGCGLIHALVRLPGALYRRRRAGMR